MSYTCHLGFVNESTPGWTNHNLMRYYYYSYYYYTFFSVNLYSHPNPKGSIARRGSRVSLQIHKDKIGSLELMNTMSNTSCSPWHDCDYVVELARFAQSVHQRKVTCLALWGPPSPNFPTTITNLTQGVNIAGYIVTRSFFLKFIWLQKCNDDPQLLYT